MDTFLEIYTKNHYNYQHLELKTKPAVIYVENENLNGRYNDIVKSFYVKQLLTTEWHYNKHCFQLKNMIWVPHLKTEGLADAVLTWTSSSSRRLSRVSSFSFSAANLLFVVASDNKR